MVRTQREKYERDIVRVRRLAELGNISERDAGKILEYAEVFDKREPGSVLPAAEAMYPASSRTPKEVSSGTLKNYLKELTKAAFWVELTDEKLVTSDLNELLSKYVNGGLPIVTIKDDNDIEREYGNPVKHSTAGQSERTLSKFFRWYKINHETNVVPQSVKAPELSEHSEEARNKGWRKEDLLTPSEEQQVWGAAGNSRDRAIFYTLRWTGMRQGAVRHLRWRDVDLENGTFSFPSVPNGEGLKDLVDPNEPRTLLHAEKALRTWETDHPHSHDPNAHIFTAYPEGRGSHGYDPYNAVAASTIGDAIAKLFRNAGIDKPDHPHMMRHLYVTTLKVVWEVDNQHIKWLIGHRKDSKVMETTYAHIRTEDHHNAVLVAGGLKQPGGQKAVYRGDTCVNCEQHTDPTASYCNTCGRVQDVNAFLRDRAADRGTTQAVHETTRDARTARDRQAADDLHSYPEANRGRQQYEQALAQQQEQLEQQAELISGLKDELQHLREDRDVTDPDAVDVAADAMGRLGRSGRTE